MRSRSWAFHAAIVTFGVRDPDSADKQERARNAGAGDLASKILLPQNETPGMPCFA
jgi:hypothetical protein